MQVAVETTALGDAVKEVIRGQIEALGATEGNPMRTPYAIRWKYRPEQAEFNKKYVAIAMPKLEMSKEIRSLIFDTPAPDITDTIAKGNAEALMSVMQRVACIDLPLEQLFAPVMGERGYRGSVQVPAGVGDTTPAPAPGGRRRATAPQPPNFPPGTVLIPCDACGAKMPDTADTCWPATRNWTDTVPGSSTKV